MTVQCTQCGEELLGSVNRCWRCGHEFVSQAGPVGLPPVRRSPIKGLQESALAAEVIEEEAAAEPIEATAQEGRWSRRGSPFSQPGSDQDAEAAEEDAAGPRGPRLPEYPRNLGAVGGAAVAIVLGLISFCLAFVFPLGALIVAVIGLAMGIWGVYSRRRGAAILGLLICCTALAIAGFNGAVELYTYVHGVSPFETFVPDPVQQ